METQKFTIKIKGRVDYEPTDKGTLGDKDYLLIRKFNDVVEQYLHDTYGNFITYLQDNTPVRMNPEIPKGATFYFDGVDDDIPQ